MPKMEDSRARELLETVDGWTLRDDKLNKRIEFDDFSSAMSFINHVAELAEREGHHPDFCLHGYSRVDLVLWTHAVRGLSENDFILAAKIDALPRGE